MAPKHASISSQERAIVPRSRGMSSAASQCAARGCEQVRLRGCTDHTASLVRTPGEPPALPYRKEPQIPNERPRILLVVAGEHRKFGYQIFTALNNTFSSGVARRTAARAIASIRSVGVRARLRNESCSPSAGLAAGCQVARQADTPQTSSNWA
jgi:hypothetical protein